VPDAIELLKTRRSVKPREMSGPGPSPTELETILTIGARVPDHGKLAPWRFIIFEGDARARAGEAIAGVFARKNPNASPAEIDVEKWRLTDAPLVIGVVSLTKPHPKVPPWEQEMSAGASAMNIVTAATALGYGACWLSGWFSIDRDVLDGLGLKADEKLAGLIHIGTVSRPSKDRPGLCFRTSSRGFRFHAACEARRPNLARRAAISSAGFAGLNRNPCTSLQPSLRSQSS
jgi:nitroreductase